MTKQTLASKGHQKDGITTINSGERLTIENATAFANSVREALAACNTVAIEFAAQVEVDVTALQILCSACKTAATEGKILIQQGSTPESLWQLIAAAGAEHPGPCHHNNNNPCIWFGGQH